MLKNHEQPTPAGRHPLRFTPYLLFAALLLVFTGSFGQVKKLSLEDFTPPQECGKCHQEIFSQWSQSMHAKSVTDPIYRAVIDKMMQRTEGAQKAFCLSCHAPVASVTGRLLETKSLNWDSFSEIEAQGVICDFCHTISGNENLGKNISVGAYVYPRKGTTAVKYGRNADAETSDHLVEPSQFLTSAEVCAICHKFKHPVAGLEIQSTYDEWQRGPYSKEGVRCQDCHMPAFSGTTATGGKQREEIHAHVFLGGHTEMIKRAATLSVWGVSEKRRDATQLKVTANVTNSGAGHTIPTGIPGIREIVLQVDVLGPAGEILGRKTFRYGQRLTAQDGSAALPWEAYKVLEDNRIEPRRSKQNSFEVSLPPRVTGNVKIEGKLFLVLISEEMSKRLEMLAPEPLLMTSAEATVSLGSR
ncbi:MAG: hypothetical protein HYX74_05110 [Acidobacteria bacterium]|nr:hypothetical protein [Acidobacteriota bacterium]